MPNILAKKKERKKQEQLSSINKHPVTELAPEFKIHYMNGLAFLVGIDEKINEQEKNYFLKLMEVFEIENTEFDEFLSIAQEQNEDVFDEFIEAITKEEGLKLNFMVDIYLLSLCDGEISDEEKELIDYYLENFEIDKQQKRIIDNVVEIVTNIDKDFLLSYYFAFKENYFNQFEYLFNYHGMKVNDIIKETYSFEWVEWEMTKGKLDGGKEVCTKPISFKQYIIYLNYLVLSDQIKHPDHEWKNSSDVYGFSYIDGKVITTEDKNFYVRGYKMDRAVSFADWISKNIYNYELNVSFLKVKPKCDIEVKLFGDYKRTYFFEFPETNKSQPTFDECFIYDDFDKGQRCYIFYENDSLKAKSFQYFEAIDWWVMMWSTFRLMKLDAK